jgi:Na+/melibiose symporter-like transporter
LHTATLLFSKEKPAENTEKVSIWKEIQELLKDKTLFKVVLISVLWNIAHFVTTPFLSTYQTKELNFTTKFASIIVMAGSFFRVLCSKPLGRYADKHSFTKMLIICYIVEALSFGLGVFIVPSNGKVMYTLHHLLYVGGMAGINSAVINLIYDYVDAKRRTSALALKQTLAGTAGFLTTLAVSPLVSRIQENGNMLFGIPVYAQQVLSLISFILTLGLLVYMLTVIRKIKK